MRDQVNLPEPWLLHQVGNSNSLFFSPEWQWLSVGAEMQPGNPCVFYGSLLGCDKGVACNFCHLNCSKIERPVKLEFWRECPPQIPSAIPKLSPWTALHGELFGQSGWPFQSTMRLDFSQKHWISVLFQSFKSCQLSAACAEEPPSDPREKLLKSWVAEWSWLSLPFLPRVSMILVVAIIIIINRYQQYVRFVRCRHDYILYSEELYLSLLSLSLTTIIYIHISFSLPMVFIVFIL